MIVAMQGVISRMVEGIGTLMDARTLCGSSERPHAALARRPPGYTGLFVAGLIWPLMISALIVFSSDRSDVGTWLAKS
jgi:hypothetical protein